MIARWRRRRHRDDVELNITAFMNLMVVLVPFLLITAVFSRLTILELNLPTAAANQKQQQAQQELQLEVIVRKHELVIADRNSGPLKRIAVEKGNYNLAEASEFLRKIKTRFPDKQDITLLLDPDVPYDVLVQVMDTVRVTVEAGNISAELFPQIAIGDAPGVK